MGTMDSLNIRVVRLRPGSVMCEVGTCANEAEFLMKQGYDRISVVCDVHLKVVGVTEAEIPLQAATASNWP